MVFVFDSAAITPRYNQTMYARTHTQTKRWPNPCACDINRLASGMQEGTGHLKGWPEPGKIGGKIRNT